MQSMEIGPEDAAMRRFWARRTGPWRPNAQLRMEDWADIDRAEAERRAQAELFQERAAVASAVAILFVVLLFIVIFLILNGSGSPHRGGGFRAGSAKLRDDAAGRLQRARPTRWSGGPGGGADSYDSAIAEQQARAQAIGQADLEAAEIVAVQADQVVQGRRELELILAALLGGIAVAEVLEARWKTALVADPLAAPAFADTLVRYAQALALATLTAALGVLAGLLVVGSDTQQALSGVIGQYKWVVDDVTAKMPASWVSTIEAPTVPESTVADVREPARQRSL